MMSQAEVTEPVCAVCLVPAKNFCSACKLVKYCGTEHQRQHWKQHKKECRPFRTAKDDILGRYLMATRDIRADGTIFIEEPLVVGPKWYLSEQEREIPVMPCVGCFTPCHMSTRRCPRCHWPACSPRCLGLKDPNIHGLECKILSLGPGPAKKEDCLSNYYRTDALLVLKCLMLQKQNPKKWHDLLDMQSHEEERKGTELQEDAEERIVSYLNSNFLLKPTQKFLSEYDGMLLRRICGIIETNYMCVSLPTGIELSGLFYTACMMEHSCQPNCYFSFDRHNGFRISVIAGRTIQKGEHLKIMYSNILWNTHMRNEHLAITKHFHCKCERCSDPTELGTYFSALNCVSATEEPCDGIQLPKDPLNSKTDWICDKCAITINGEEVRYLLTQMTEEVETLLAQKPSIKQVENLMNKLGTFLHNHHYHMFSLKHTLIQLYGKEPGFTINQLSNALLEKKLDMCKELNDICRKLDPSTIRLSIYVSIILYEMHTVLVEKSKRLFALENKTLDEVKALQEEALQHLSLATHLLKKEMDNIAGSKLNDCIVKSIEEVKSLIEKSNLKVY
uniref:MYND-type domain-containing protein n=1 Tax=Glossina palpalis gambiensis TaxID=67801 RepID=A0A1B0B1W6_9MUSC